jgi:hypothetical protein
VSRTRQYRCVITWDIDAEDPIDAAHLMWSSVKNSPGPIVNVWIDCDRSVDVDLTYPEETRDTDGSGRWSRGIGQPSRTRSDQR